MPRANRSNKGNKKRGVFDRTIVPQNGYQLHVDPPDTASPDLPLVDVGQRCTILNVIIYEVSISYEGKPQKFIKRIKFSDIVGSPVSDAQLAKGYEFDTPQGERLWVKWHLGSSNENGGLMIHNRSAKGTSYYEPNWGQVFGVGLEWLSCDGLDGGIIWANRHIGNTTGALQTDGSYKLTTNTFTGTVSKDYSPNAIRPGLMLGNPEPYRALWIMGDLMPMRVYPALGQINQGCIFGFNKNVMKWVYIKPPIEPYLTVSGVGTSRADVINVNWRKSEFHEGNTVLGAMLVNDPSGLVTSDKFGTPNDRGVYIISKPTTGSSGSLSTQVNFRSGQGSVTYRFMVLECDAAGIPQYTLQCTELTWHWGVGSGSTNIYTFGECSLNLPYPLKPEGVCAAEGSGGGGTTNPTNPTLPPVDVPLSSYSYFCDGSVASASIDTSFWKGEKALSAAVAAGVQGQYGVTISPEYWEGRNSWLELFAKMDSSTPYRNSKITVAPFHKYLFKALTEVRNQTADPIEANSWAEFKVWCEASGLDCLTELQMASLYMTYLLQVPVNFFSSASGYLSGTILDVMAANLLLLPQGLMDWIDFNDVAIDSANSITGAFAADIPDPQFKAFSSFVNFEPQALQYTIDSGIGHRPFDYVKPAGSQWGSATAVNWQSYWLSEMTDANFKPYVAAEVGIHEIGHAVAYHGLDFYGKTIHERPDWLAISGWSASSPDQSPNNVAAHLVKTRSASQTGGLPKTDAGYEAPVSDYGCFHPAEDFAEAYRLYILNPVFLEQKYPQKYQFMVNVVEPMFIT